jgi:PAS domain S-box-containing protein
MSIKFIFIFFFRAAYEPGFMFNLIPFYILSGVNNLHLLFLSLLIVILNAYLHIKINKKKLLFSFIPTVIMLISLGLAIASREMNSSIYSHLLIFGCILIIVLIDHKQFLVFPITIDFLKKPSVQTNIQQSVPKILKPRHQSVKNTGAHRSHHIKNLYELVSLHKKTLSDLKAFIKVDLQKAKNIIEELERKTKTIGHRGVHLDKKIHTTSSKNPNNMTFVLPINNDKKEHYLFIDNMQDGVAIVQCGILKKVNNRFAKLLGYRMNEVVGKSLFGFISPESFLDIERYYLDRLKGVDSLKYNAIFLTKDKDKLKLEVSTKSTKFNGEKAEFTIIKKN